MTAEAEREKGAVRVLGSDFFLHLIDEYGATFFLKEQSIEVGECVGLDVRRELFTYDDRETMGCKPRIH